MRRVNFIKILIAISVISTAGFYFCEKSSAPYVNAPAAKEQLQSSPWEISQARVNGTDFTGTFKGYNLSFNRDGSIAAISGNDSKTGFWSIGTGTGPGKLSMNFGNDQAFRGLNNDWRIVGTSPGLIRLSGDEENNPRDEMILKNNNGESPSPK